MLKWSCRVAVILAGLACLVLVMRISNSPSSSSSWVRVRDESSSATVLAGTRSPPHLSSSHSPKAALVTRHRLHLVTFAHKLPPSASDLPGTCRFLYSARVAGGFRHVIAIGLGMRRRDKMNSARFQRALMDMLHRSNIFNAEHRHDPISSRRTSPSLAEGRGEDDIVVYSDLFDVVFLKAAEAHVSRFNAFTGGSNDWRADRKRNTPQSHVVFQGDRTNFCPLDIGAYDSYYGKAQHKQRHHQLNSSDFIRDHRPFLFYPFPNSGWFMGQVSSLKEVIPVVFPEKTSGIDQGHACAEISRQGLLRRRVVLIDAFANLTLNMNPPTSRLLEQQRREDDSTDLPSKDLETAAADVDQLKLILESSLRGGVKVKDSAIDLAGHGFLSLHFSGPSKMTVFPEVRGMLREYFTRLWPENEDIDWRSEMLITALDGVGGIRQIAVSSICPKMNPFSD